MKLKVLRISRNADNIEIILQCPSGKNKIAIVRVDGEEKYFQELIGKEIEFEDNQYPIWGV